MIRSIREITPRQREIAVHIGKGLSYAEIGGELGISAHTVRAHVRTLANMIDVDDGALPPRSRILLLIKHEEWTTAQQVPRRG